VKDAENIGMQGNWKNDIQWSNFTTDLIIDDLGKLPLIISNLSKINKLS
jgi:hypothetical protein